MIAKAQETLMSLQINNMKVYTDTKYIILNNQYKHFCTVKTDKVMISVPVRN